MTFYHLDLRAKEILDRLNREKIYHLVKDVVLAEKLGVSASTVRRWRAENIGPKWVKVGKRGIRYSLPDAGFWLEGRINAYLDGG